MIWVLFKDWLSCSRVTTNVAELKSYWEYMQFRNEWIGKAFFITDGADCFGMNFLIQGI